ncbi:MAG: transposase [Alphaproteobacteria bacterium]|nr:transposase [Alphaproteobacteria bacterium]
MNSSSWPSAPQTGANPPANYRSRDIFWIVVTSLPWHDLSEEFGKWFSITRRFGGGPDRSLHSA